MADRLARVDVRPAGGVYHDRREGSMNPFGGIPVIAVFGAVFSAWDLTLREILRLPVPPGETAR